MTTDATTPLDLEIHAERARTRNRQAQREDKTADEAAKKASEEESRILEILQRGIMADRLTIRDIPEGMMGCWVRDRPADITRYEALGFRVYKEGEKTNEDGVTTTRKVGDVILMICTQENWDLIQRVKRKRAARKKDVPKKEFHRKNQEMQVPTYEDTSGLSD